MDLGKVFQIFNYIVMVLGGLVILGAILLVIGVNALTADAGDLNQNGMTFLTFLMLVPSIGVGVLSFLSGHAGLHSDPDRCRKCSKILLGLMVLSAVSALRGGTFNFITLVELAIYGFYCYLAHTQSY